MSRKLILPAAELIKDHKKKQVGLIGEEGTDGKIVAP